MPYDTFQNITFQQLESLIHLVAERNFSRAASRMALTQPSLSKHIQKLEEATECRLVNRDTAGITLTAEGHILYDIAKKVIALRSEAKDRLAKLGDTESGSIHLCASTIPSTYLLPKVLSAFRLTHPDIHTHMMSTNSDEAIDLVTNGVCEIGVIGKAPSHRKLATTSLWEDRLVLVVPACWPKPERQMLRPADLFGIPFILREKGSATRETLSRYLKHHADKDVSAMKVVAELGSSEAVKEGIIAGLGASILSEFAVMREVRQGLVTLLQIEGWDIRRHFVLIHRKNTALPRHIVRFMDFLKDFRKLDKEGCVNQDGNGNDCRDSGCPVFSHERNQYPEQ